MAAKFRTRWMSCWSCRASRARLRMSCWEMRLIFKAGVVVDTHVTRLSHRLGFTQQKTAEKIEQDLIPIVPKKDWVIFPHLMIYHGRKICKARNPLCAECTIEKQCPSSFLLLR